MPVHDWGRACAGVFYHFHHGWVEELKRALNRGVLPPDHYAMVERAVPSGPGMPIVDEEGDKLPCAGGAPGGRNQSTVTVRHASGDRVVAMVEVVSPGNKSGNRALQNFVRKAGELLDKGVHLLILDVQPPTPRDPHGIHAAIWEEVSGQASPGPPAKPLTLASYESDEGAVSAYVLPVAPGESLPEMPLYLEPRGCVVVPLEATYRGAFDAVPGRWRRVLEAEGPV